MPIYKEVDELLNAMDTWDKFGDSFGLFRLNKSNEKDYVPYVRYEDMVQAVTGTPHADVAPVIHAHWEIIYESSAGVTDARCSNCGFESLAYENDVHTDENCNYCPCCGAKMDEAEIIGKRMIDGFIDGMGDNVKSVGQKFINNDKDTVEHTIMGMKNEVTHETG